MHAGESPFCYNGCEECFRATVYSFRATPRTKKKRISVVRYRARLGIRYSPKKRRGAAIEGQWRGRRIACFSLGRERELECCERRLECERELDRTSERVERRQPGPLLLPSSFPAVRGVSSSQFFTPTAHHAPKAFDLLSERRIGTSMYERCFPRELHKKTEGINRLAYPFEQGDFLLDGSVRCLSEQFK